MNWIAENLGIGTETQAKLLGTIVVLVVLAVARAVTVRAARRQIGDGESVYRIRKATTYVATILAAITLGFIWLDAFSSFPTYLGLLSAGVAIALADLLKNIAGWGYILARRPFRVGDRVEVAGTRGDVVDVRLFRFTLMEVGNWVDADQSTGRLVHIPNGLLFTEKVANYTEGFEFVWHEVPVLVTFESDWRRAEAILRDAMDEHAPAIDERAATRIRRTASSYHIKIGALTPNVYLTVKDSGVLLTGRFLTDARQRRTTEHAVWRHVLDGFAAAANVDLAYPTVRTFFAAPVDIAVATPSAEADIR